MFYENTNFAAIVPDSIMAILKNDITFKNPKLLENALLFITHLKLQNHIYKDTEEQNPAIGYHSDLLRAIFSSDYYIKSVERLIQLGIIEKSGFYSPGNRSYQFKLADKYFFERSIIYPYKYKGVIKKIINIKQKFYKNRYLKLKPYLHQQYDNLQCLFIDKEEADKWITEQEPIWVEENDKKPKNQQKNIMVKVNYYLDSVNKIHHGFLHNLSVSLSNSRFNTVLTSFPKALRKFLYIQDICSGMVLNKKIEIDGSNTQPLMLCLYLESNKYEIEPEVKQLCLSGLLYDTIAHDMNETREWVKQRIMDTLLFTKSNGAYTLKFKDGNDKIQEIRKFAKYCSTAYPKFFKALITEKQRLELLENHPVNWINPGGSELAKRIQKMESEIWIHTLLKEMPENMFYATIHDSIMIFDPSIEDVIKTRNKILEVGYRLHGIRLPLKLEFHNIEEQEKKLYLYEFNSNTYHPEIVNENSENNSHTQCLKTFKINDTVSQDEREHTITTVSSETFEKLFKTKRKS
ncbi:MAG: hypothetical protein EPN82_07095 [Bacteroidetes bacterium]|nr:MAG: hypothetical protein EPN82_07095 [Bacteroidota bacterium]